MKISICETTKYVIKSTSSFDKDLKKISKQGKDISKLEQVVTKLANEEVLEVCFKNHRLKDDNNYKDCYECHIEPDWLLIYKYVNDELILLLVNTGSHSELFK